MIHLSGNESTTLSIQSPSVRSSKRPKAVLGMSYSFTTSTWNATFVNLRQCLHRMHDSMAYDPKPLLHCLSCGLIHSQTAEGYFCRCFFITIRCRRSPVSATWQTPDARAVYTIPVPVSPEERAALRDRIWKTFQQISSRNDDERKAILAREKSKGCMRTHAPLLWLGWDAGRGLRGQTRNEKNFNRLWERFVDGHGYNVPKHRLIVNFPLADFGTGDLRQQAVGDGVKRISQR